MKIAEKYRNEETEKKIKRWEQSGREFPLYTSGIKKEKAGERRLMQWSSRLSFRERTTKYDGEGGEQEEEEWSYE